MTIVVTGKRLTSVQARAAGNNTLRSQGAVKASLVLMLRGYAKARSVCFPVRHACMLCLSACSFTAWLGNNSTQGKQRRLLGELSTTLRASSHVVAPRGAVRLEYAAALRTLLTARLRREEEGGIAPTVQLMEEYCINRSENTA